MFLSVNPSANTIVTVTHNVRKSRCDESWEWDELGGENVTNVQPGQQFDVGRSVLVAQVHLVFNLQKILSKTLFWAVLMNRLFIVQCFVRIPTAGIENNVLIRSPLKILNCLAIAYLE